MAILGEKLDGGPMDRLADMLRIVSGALFLRSSRVRPTLLGQREKLPHAGTVCGKRMNGVRGPAQEEYVACVSGFFYMVYIYLNRLDFRI
jgi:hypothetical protein